jgi:cobyrinic acid a,c-diamide synthase
VPPAATATHDSTTPLRIAIALDAAFGFYYSDDLAALQAAGATLVPFNTLKDAALPPCDALLIGGGFPESFLKELSANSALRADIRHQIEAGLPTYAECGGLMYLARSIVCNGETQPMVGVIPGDIRMHRKPIGRGYVILTPTDHHPWRSPDDADSRLAGADFFGPQVYAHEFHYSELADLPDDIHFAYKIERGHGIDGQRDGIVLHHMLASYTHLRGVAGSDWPTRFIAYIHRCRQPATPASHLVEETAS